MRSCKLGDRVGPDDYLTVDGEQLGGGIVEQKPVYYLSKPVGQICSRKDQKNEKQYSMIYLN